MIFFVGGFVSDNKLKQNLKYNSVWASNMYIRLLELDTIKNVEILIVGSSHAYRGFDPRIFKRAGFKVFNLGSSNQTHIQTKQLLQQYLNRIKPKLVIYEVFPGTLQHDGVESSLDLINNGRLDLNTLEMVFKVNHIITYNTFLYGIIENLIGGQDHKKIVNNNVDQYVSGGYVERKLQYNNQQPKKLSFWKVRDDQLNALKWNLNFLIDQQIPYILVQAPITESKYKKFVNRNEVDSLLNSLGRYINFNEQNLAINDSLNFYDTHHLNQSGVEIFNISFIKWLTKYGDIKF